MTGPAPAECRDVSRRFGQVVAVDSVDLSLHPGEVVGLLGANGAGKTTLIRMLLGLLPASAGQVLLFGSPPSRRARRRIGYVPQALGLYPDLTAEENLAFSAAVYGRSRHVAAAEPGPPAQGYGGVLVGELPLGAQRRLAFDAALGHAPDLLILDEPTSGVDPLARARLWETIAGAAAGGVGVLITTHYMDEAAECDRLVVMADGRVVAQGTAAEIVGDAVSVLVEAQEWMAAFSALESAGLPAALAGRALRVPGASLARVRQALGTVSAQVSVVPATLDERFFQLTAMAGPDVAPRDAGGSRAATADRPPLTGADRG